MNKIFKRAIPVFLAAFLAALIFVSPVFAQSGAQNAISQAKDTITTCYGEVKQAESAGANVDSLMGTLNEAAGLLTKAELANSANDFSSANNYAAQCQSKLSGLADQANALKNSAQSSTTQNSVITVLLLAASIGILCSGIVAWIVLGRRERRSVNGPSTV